MPYELLISTNELARHIDDAGWLVVDCRFLLLRPDEKQELYQRAHIPGAVYAHLDHDLAAPVVPGVTGRHPLPTREEAAVHFGAMGIGPDTQVVAYDDQGGSLAAVRLWWMLRWLGHSAVAVLDGGWPRWLEEDRPTRAGVETHPPQTLPIRPPLEQPVDRETLEAALRDPSCRVLDVRAPERYRGEVEPLDRIPGHIPGAHNAPYTDNLSEAGTFRSPEALRAVYQARLGDIPAERVIIYCGSGVTSIHTLLALQLAGLGQARLYPGSYSEWVADVNRPVATGDQP